MKRWRRRLYAFTGLFTVIGIWTPLLWLISHTVEYYDMDSFDIAEMHLFNAVLLVGLAGVTVIVQIGFILIAQDLAEHEQRSPWEP